MNRKLVIRNARQSDIATLSEFAIKTYSDAFGHTFTDADLAAHLKKNLTADSFSRILDDDVVLLAEVEDLLLGYIQFGAVTLSSADNSEQELRRLYVHAEFQNEGYGTALMEAALRHPRLSGAAGIYLDVWEHNHAAQRFYRRFGFDVIGTRPFEVESGAATSHDFVMERRATPDTDSCDR